MGVLTELRELYDLGTNERLEDIGTEIRTEEPVKPATSLQKPLSVTTENKAGWKADCLSCEFYWKDWCAAEAPSYYSISCLSGCPLDASASGSSLEELYGHEPLRRCMDCLLRHSCRQFQGLAWWYPDCHDFRKNN